MAKPDLKIKIRNGLKKHYFKASDDYVDVSDAPEGGIHVVVITHKFEGMRQKQRIDLVSLVLDKFLAKGEDAQITMVMGLSPEELKAGIW